MIGVEVDLSSGSGGGTSNNITNGNHQPVLLDGTGCTTGRSADPTRLAAIAHQLFRQ
jgi:hypothetical protein